MKGSKGKKSKLNGPEGRDIRFRLGVKVRRNGTAEPADIHRSCVAARSIARFFMLYPAALMDG